VRRSRPPIGCARLHPAGIRPATRGRPDDRPGTLSPSRAADRWHHEADLRPGNAEMPVVSSCCIGPCSCCWPDRWPGVLRQAICRSSRPVWPVPGPSAPPGLPASLGGMGRAGSVTRAVVSIAAWPLIIIFSPVIVLVGEPINRQIMRRARWSASTTAMAVDRHSGEPALATAVRLPLRSSRFLTVISNPLWIALTAPGRWAGGWFRTQPHEPAGPLSGTRPPCAGQLATTARR
jgi:hypothetical protein